MIDNIKISYIVDGIEGFRERLTDMLMRNVRRPFDYRLALKYGLVKEDVKRVKFYFESQGDEND